MPMSAQPLSIPTGRGLAGRYTRVFIVYLLGMGVLWLVGIEGIYGHPTPFYALYHPVFTGPSQPLMIAGILGLSYWLLSQRYLGRRRGRYHAGLAAWGLWTVLFAVQAAYEYSQLRLAAPEAAAAHRDVLLRQIPPITLLVVALVALLQVLRRTRWFGVVVPPRPAAGPRALGGTLYIPKAQRPASSAAARLGTRQTAWLLTALAAFAILFPCAIACMRGGGEGISQAYARSTYEYIGDIGTTASIQQFFARYNEIHPYLSMHSKVHPPGPVALLWLFSLLLGNSAFTLSVVTIVFGALGVIPLYCWVRELAGQRTAVTAALLYVCVPSIVLFTATSADILFTPFTLTTLFCFERAIRRGSIPAAIVAGLGYACMSLLSFSLIGVGAYFGLAGLWRLRDRVTRRHVFQTAALMLSATLAFHAAVWLWSGFNVIECFQLAKQQFDLDQHHLDQLSPRLPAWTYRILNPLTWFYFAGIPVSLLFLQRLWPLSSQHRATVVICFATLFILNLLYLARGEGERSALYLMPFLVIPAAMLLDDLGRKQNSPGPLAATLAFMAFQCWFTEMYFYTYW